MRMGKVPTGASGNLLFASVVTRLGALSYWMHMLQNRFVHSIKVPIRIRKDPGLYLSLDSAHHEIFTTKLVSY